MRMRGSWLWALAGSVALGTGCGVEDDEAAEDALGTSRARLVAGCALSSVDGDVDGVDDGLENCLLQRHAPVLYLPLDLDWTRPSSVDWYLARTHLRFHHDGCPDCSILALGSVTQTSLLNRSHGEKNWLCAHTSTLRSSSSGEWVENETFFLQPPDDATHGGSANPADWKVYGHVYRNRFGGVNLQYWWFFPYNDGPAGFNHEADWEHVNVRLAPDYTVSGVHFAHHASVSYFAAGDVQWLDATHPLVWVADGSHASYRDESTCDTTYEELGWGFNSCQTNSNYRWFTWVGGKGTRAGYQGGGVINVGERTRTLGGQEFLRYNSRWGEVGNSSTTSGVRGPAMQGNWTRDT